VFESSFPTADGRVFVRDSSNTSPFAVIKQIIQKTELLLFTGKPFTPDVIFARP
jgi:hypothetical protein